VPRVRARTGRVYSFTSAPIAKAILDANKRGVDCEVILDKSQVTQTYSEATFFHNHPKYIEDVTIGLLCDVTRYTGADDPVEWDIFRTMVLQSQGWKLHWIWTPHFFRDPVGHIQQILSEVQSFLANEKPRDGLQVVPEQAT
jgi:hypothetical protein